MKCILNMCVWQTCSLTSQKLTILNSSTLCKQDEMQFSAKPGFKNQPDRPFQKLGSLRVFWILARWQNRTRLSFEAGGPAWHILITTKRMQKVLNLGRYVAKLITSDFACWLQEYTFTDQTHWKLCMRYSGLCNDRWRHYKDLPDQKRREIGQKLLNALTSAYFQCTFSFYAFINIFFYSRGWGTTKTFTSEQS